jgi:hypothetical protein
MESLMQRMLAAIGQVSHAAALWATARTMLALSVGVAMAGVIFVMLEPELQLVQGVFLFSALLSVGVVVSLFVVAVQLIVYTRLGMRRMDPGISWCGLLRQAGHWMGLGAALVMVQVLMNPVWEYVEAPIWQYAEAPIWEYMKNDPTRVMEVVGFSVLVGAALGILVGLSRLKITAESSIGLATRP